MKPADLLDYDVPSPSLRARRGAARALLTLGVPCLLLWVLAGLSAVGGTRFVGSGRFAGLDLWASAVLYPVSIALAGAIAGAGVPFARSSVRAALLGAVAGLAGGLCLALAFESPGPVNWTRWLVVGSLTGIALGVPVGVSTYRDERRAAAPRQRRGRKRRGAAA